MLLIIMKRKGTGAQTIPNSELFQNQSSVILERVLDFNLIYLLKSIDLHSILLKWLSPGRGCLSSSPDGQNRMDQKEHEKKAVDCSSSLDPSRVSGLSAWELTLFYGLVPRGRSRTQEGMSGWSLGEGHHTSMEFITSMDLNHWD